MSISSNEHPQSPARSHFVGTSTLVGPMRGSKGVIALATSAAKVSEGIVLHQQLAQLAQLDEDGFAVVESITDLEDIAVIRNEIDELLRRGHVPKKELGERGGSPQIIEILWPMKSSERIARSCFVRNACAASEAYFGHRVTHNFDHAIIKPAFNFRETAWHQDFAYSPWFSFSARKRLHWWLPLHDVSTDQGCMHFVRGSHRMGSLPHVRVAATSDALKTTLPENADVVACPLKAGSATVHTEATLHFTGPNKTSAARYAFILQLERSTWATRLRTSVKSLVWKFGPL
ncbi:phytanoyl-CoA dioxygenase family protein [Bradyrhizobium sp. SSUT112]|uniref:phytanoyl-CoA dioxygenase family protein n=1 Tax=Bradyrhizobium sp. SSUT112 TaxID=3040604 RepID=UPI00244D2979|nr:phytanoyl-CoA dioxygenase family protein [Bradyrhizobium sp. SSUT112]MDH2352580.1 phytanoyl-CoA dioxygenase family protein [Bradyrhizobium sp. SSUT112]